MIRGRSSLLIVVLSALVTGRANASWGPEPVVVHPGTSLQLLDSATDGHYGAYFLWQEGARGTAGILRLQHLLATGDVDPNWSPQAVKACSVSVIRDRIGIVPDGMGGVHAWWTEGTQLYARHMLASGTGDPRWPKRGVLLANGARQFSTPCVVPDGAGGIYACWVSTTWNILVSHYETGGLPVPGWPASGRMVSSVLLASFSPSIAPTLDGGIHVAWSALSSDSAQAPPGFYARRLTGGGGAAPGWSDPLVPSTSRVGVGGEFPTVRIASDPEGGAVVLTSEGTDDPYRPLFRMHRRLEDGSTAPGWSDSGLTRVGGESAFAPYLGNPTLICTRDGLIILGASGQFTIDGPENMSIEYRVRLDGQCLDCGPMPNGPYGDVFDIEPDPDRGHHSIVSNPCWYPNWWDVIPFTSHVYASSRRSFPDGRSASYLLDGGWPEPGPCSFDPVTITPTGDGGAIAGWLGLYSVTGLVAVRIGAAGAVTSVSAEVDHSRPFVTRYLPGQGLRLTLEVPSPDEGRVECFDLLGRAVAAAGLPRGALGVTIPGTRSLPSGVYLLRLHRGANREYAKVVVTR